MINLYRIIHPVADIDKAARFFAAVFGNDGERVSPGRHYFDCGDTILACYDPAADGDELAGGWRHHENQYIYFAVDNLDVVKSAVIEAGGEITADIESMPWGERLFYARDPFGNPIAFVDAATVFTGS
ncbi:MAG: VOC family protein [Woeseiaceae bacterium]|nr:VOC family protein [Woeseiaceae bacterium]